MSPRMMLFGVMAAWLTSSCLMFVGAAGAQTIDPQPPPADLRGGANFLPTKVYSEEDDRKSLEQIGRAHV